MTKIKTRCDANLKKYPTQRAMNGLIPKFRSGGIWDFDAVLDGTAQQPAINFYKRHPVGVWGSGLGFSLINMEFCSNLNYFSLSQRDFI
jgi:hypothetical protein